MPRPVSAILALSALAVLCAACGPMQIKSPVASAAADVDTRWACQSAPGADERRAQVRDGLLPRVTFLDESPQTATVDARRAYYRAPSVSVAVIRNGAIDWTAAFGETQAGGAAADCGTLYQAGSIAKPATLLAAVRMREKGLLDFDAPIETYLKSFTLPPGAHSTAHPVTLRNLFSHTSGVRPGGYPGYAQGDKLPTDAQIARGESPANTPKIEVVAKPGEELAYAGGGYTLIEIALQDKLGQPFEQIMNDWLIRPAGLKQADFTQPLPEHARHTIAKGHQRDGTTVPGGWNVHPEQAAAGLWATPSDLATLLIEMHKAAQGKSTLIGKASLDELLANPVDGHSWGFRRIGPGDNVFLTHNGGTVGYRASMTINLKTGDGAVVMSNSDNGGDLGAEIFRAVSKAYDWRGAFKDIKVRRVVRDAAVLASLAGRYAFPEGPPVSVAVVSTVLTVVFPNGDRYAMTPVEGGPLEFIHAPSGVRAGFTLAGAEAQMRLYGQTGKRQ